MEAKSISIAISDDSRGYPVSPRRVPLSLLHSFSEDVQTFIRGSEKEVPAEDIEVEVKDGSLALETKPLLAPTLFRDLRGLGDGFDLSKIDSKRRAVVERWQAAAKSGVGRMVRITSGFLDKPILISHDTNYRVAEFENWVDVERYVHGELMDLGGAKNSNAHIKLPDGTKLLVRTDKDLIRAEKENLVYRQVHLRIKAKYNLDTGELRDPTLIEFVDYSPKFDEAAFNRAVERGTVAWGDADPIEWVRKIRGSDQ